MLGESKPKFNPETASKLPFIYITRYIHNFHIFNIHIFISESSLEYGDCKNSKTYQHF